MSALLERALAKANLRALLMPSGRAALEFLNKAAPAKRPPIDFFLTDRNLPDIGGEDLFRFFRGVPERAAIPVALMSADLNPDARERYFALGFTEIFRKPFEPEKVAHRIAEIIHLVSSVAASDEAFEWNNAKSIDADQIVDEELQREFIAGLDVRIRAIDAARSSLAAGAIAAIEDLRREAHKIAGTAVMFGVPEFEAPASDLESIAEKITDRNGPPDEEELAMMVDLVATLNNMLMERYR